MKPMSIEQLMDQEVQNLSGLSFYAEVLAKRDAGGELQRVALVLALGQPADLYLIDEPSAYMDSEQRIIAAKVIKRFVMHAKKTAFVVEHDFIMATYMADRYRPVKTYQCHASGTVCCRVVVYEGKPSVEAVALRPQSLQTGMNLFLENLDITFRRDPTNYRPRINKHESVKDKEQKMAGTFYYLDD